MSQKQWGCGYYVGLKEADAHLGLKRYIAELYNGHLQTLYRVLAENGDVFTVEDITSYLFTLTVIGYTEWFGIPGKDDDTIHENVSEIKGNEDMIFFSSRQACESWVIADWKKWIKEKEVQE